MICPGQMWNDDIQFARGRGLMLIVVAAQARAFEMPAKTSLLRLWTATYIVTFIFINAKIKNILNIH
jgi:hypothetical protein